jgi:cell division protein FtsA
MSVRLEEILQLIARELEPTGLLDYLRAGVFLCGGGSRVPQIQALAERVFELPTSIGQASSISGLKSALDQPEFATAIGLVRFASFQQRPAGRPGLARGLRHKVGQLFRSVKR